MFNAAVCRTGSTRASQRLTTVVMSLACALAWLLWPGAVPADLKVCADGDWALYDADAGHPWNRVFRVLYERIDQDGNSYGCDQPDPLLYADSDHLTSDSRLRRITKQMKRFMRERAADRVSDPVAHVLFQQDLWAVFDWSVTQSSNGDDLARHLELQRGLVRLMRSVALSPDAIAALPDNYRQTVDRGTYPARYDPNARAQPFLPSGLLDGDNAWVLLSGDDAAAYNHRRAFGGRDTFFVAMASGGDRRDTFFYIIDLNQRITQYVEVALKMAKGELTAPPVLRPVPVPPGTMFALLRRARHIGRDGAIYTTPVTRFLQLRVYRDAAVTQQYRETNTGLEDQDVYMFIATRGPGGSQLLPVTATDYLVPDPFMNNESDPFRTGTGLTSVTLPRLTTCASCHSVGGIWSARTITQAVERGSVRAHVSIAGVRDVEYEFDQWSARDFHRGYLLAMWRAAPPEPEKTPDD